LIGETSFPDRHSRQGTQSARKKEIVFCDRCRRIAFQALILINRKQIMTVPSLTTLACLLTAPVLALSLCLTARAADAGLVSPADRTFVHKVGLGGMYEVDASKVAQDKGTSQDVKDFSANEIKDHVQVNDELKSIATTKGIDVPAQADAKFQKMLDELRGKSGSAFDAAYLKSMAKIHDGDEALFVKESKTTKDPELKAFAAKTAKIVKGHIDLLQGYKAK
jgi:putative membrane protein